MKTIQANTLTAWAAAALIVITTTSASARESSEFSLETASEAPKTAAEKLQSLQNRHQQAFADLTTTLNRLHAEPDFLGTKELFANIDKSARDMKNIRAGCSSLMSSLRSELKMLTESSSFTDEQKQELKDTADAMAAECGELAGKLDLAIERLGAAYVILPKWNRIHKAYRNLQGPDKAAQQVKAQVEEYLQSFVSKPQEADDETPPAEDEEA